MNQQTKNFLKVEGEVIHGDKRGREIGFPTANLGLKDFSIISENLDFGVYASLVKVQDKWYKSVTHFGPSKTFGIDKPSVEVHIFDFNKDIYGKKLELKIFDKIRETVKFDSVERLILEIKNDVNSAKSILENKK